MYDKSFAEVHRDLSVIYDTMQSITKDLGDMLPSKKARSAQHYMFQAMVIVLAFRAQIRQQMETAGIDPLVPDENGTDSPF